MEQQGSNETVGSLDALDVDLMNPWSYGADWISEVCQDPDV